MNVQLKLHAPKGQKNTFGKYNYRSCEDILQAVKPICKEEGVVVKLTDTIVEVGGWHYVTATASMTDIETGEEVNTTASARESEMLELTTPLTVADLGYLDYETLNLGEVTVKINDMAKQRHDSELAAIEAAEARRLAKLKADQERLAREAIEEAARVEAERLALINAKQILEVVEDIVKIDIMEEPENIEKEELSFDEPVELSFDEPINQAEVHTVHIITTMTRVELLAKLTSSGYIVEV
ncbi:unnamed protein product [marine sediment metagenome]|uniref:Uncharacterized protein n=1 Tax=marine sediment metagenome TaxID=412755 RepID=X1CVV4_9ZZZZ